MSERRQKHRRQGPNGKQQEICSQIREDIKRGNYKPGDRLPCRDELRDFYCAGPVTIQRAFDKLKEDGFIVSLGKRGTFVAEHPPCFCNYAIVFPHDFSNKSPKVNFYRILADLAKNDTRREDCYFTVYDKVTGHADDPSYIRLYDDIMRDCIAGVIFIVSVAKLKHTPLYKEVCSRKNLMKVALNGAYDIDEEIPRISFQNNGVIEKIFDFLEMKKVKKLAVISALIGDGSDFKVPNEDYIFSEAAKRGIELRRSNFQVRYPDLAPRTRELAELLFSGKAEDCPDGLWIMTDSLVKAATQGILDAGIKVPDDLTVISHCNFPMQPDAKVATSWYGVDILNFIDKALEIMHKNRSGDKVGLSTFVPIRFCFN